MRTLEIRRHSFTKKGDARGRGSHLSQEGVTAARGLGASVGRFDLVVASTSPRTLETALAMGFAVDEVLDMPSPTATGEIEFHAWRAWDDPFATLRAKAAASGVVAAYLDEQTAHARAVVARVSDGGHALVVGHGGWIESVVAGLVGPVPAAGLGGSFWHLDGIRLSIDEDWVTVEAVDRYAPTTDRRLGGPPGRRP